MARLTPRLAFAVALVLVLGAAGGYLALRGWPGAPVAGPSFAERGANRVAYLAPDAAGVYNLWALPVAGGAPERLSDFDAGVWDYAVSPDGRLLAAGVLRGEGQAADLWLLASDGSGSRRLLDCGGAACRAPAWSPDGARLAYERRVTVPGGQIEEVTVWVVPLAGGEPAPLLPGSQAAGHSPRWAPRGARLAYIAAPGGAVEIVDLADGFHTTFATHLGEPASWAPDGETLVVGDSVPLGEMLLSHLFVADLRAGTLRELGAADPSDDGSAAWSPRGDWIAFGRRQIGGAAATLGRQLWLARPDGGEARALTAEPAANYSAFAWSPDAGRLLAVRFALGEPGARPAVWLFDVSAGEGRELVEGATQPGWVP